MLIKLPSAGPHLWLLLLSSRIFFSKHQMSYLLLMKAHQTVVLMASATAASGEGGAGTWSDGKLTTKVGRNSDPVRRVLQTLHHFGAPQVSIL